MFFFFFFFLISISGKFLSLKTDSQYWHEMAQIPTPTAWDKRKRISLISYRDYEILSITKWNIIINHYSIFNAVWERNASVIVKYKNGLNGWDSYAQKQVNWNFCLQSNHTTVRFYLQVYFYSIEPAVCKENQKATANAVGITW